MLQPPEQQSGSHSGEGIPGQHWAGETSSKIPLCMFGGVRLGIGAGLARPKSHPTESGLQGSGESEPGAGLALGTRGENKAKPPKCIRWGAASTKQQTAGFQLRIFLFSPFLKAASPLNCASFCTNASERRRAHLSPLLQCCSLWCEASWLLGRARGQGQAPVGAMVNSRGYWIGSTSSVVLGPCLPSGGAVFVRLMDLCTF